MNKNKFNKINTMNLCEDVVIKIDMIFIKYYQKFTFRKLTFNRANQIIAPVESVHSWFNSFSSISPL